MWLLPWAILAAEGYRDFGLFSKSLCLLFVFLSFSKISLQSQPQLRRSNFCGFFFFCGSFLGLGNLAGETTAVWWPPPPSPYPLLLRIRKKPAPVYSGRKFPFSTQPEWSQYSKQPFPNSAALSTAQGGTQRDWQGLEGRKNISRADGVHPPTQRTCWPALSPWRCC